MQNCFDLFRQLNRIGIGSTLTDELAPADGLPDPPGFVKKPTIKGLPSGYEYGVTRYADVILHDAFPERYKEFHTVLSDFRIDVRELLSGGGSKSSIAGRFDAMLAAHGWGKRTITIKKLIDDRLIHAARGHEIDMFGPGAEGDGYPGIAIEMEWNNKDPFFDRDLLNFAALHREGALAVGVIVTRGPMLQRYAGPVIKTSERQNSLKYAQSTTHWDKIIPRINLGGGEECPIFVVGIEPDRIDGFDVVVEAHGQHQKLW
jgi:hypothetical protein